MLTSKCLKGSPERCASFMNMLRQTTSESVHTIDSWMTASDRICEYEAHTLFISARLRVLAENGVWTFRLLRPLSKFWRFSSCGDMHFHLRESDDNRIFLALLGLYEDLALATYDSVHFHSRKLEENGLFRAFSHLIVCFERFLLAAAFMCIIESRSAMGSLRPSQTNSFALTFSSYGSIHVHFRKQEGNGICPAFADRRILVWRRSRRRAGAYPSLMRADFRRQCAVPYGNGHMYCSGPSTCRCASFPDTCSLEASESFFWWNSPLKFSGVFPFLERK